MPPDGTQRSQNVNPAGHLWRQGTACPFSSWDALHAQLSVLQSAAISTRAGMGWTWIVELSYGLEPLSPGSDAASSAQKPGVPAKRHQALGGFASVALLWPGINQFLAVVVMMTRCPQHALRLDHICVGSNMWVCRVFCCWCVEHTVCTHLLDLLRPYRLSLSHSSFDINYY